MGAPRRLGLAGVLVVAGATMLLGFAHKSYCLLGSGGFDALVYRAYCYSDIPPLYRQRGLIDGEIPYLEGRNEYPVGTGLVMWVSSLLGRGEGSFLLANVLILSVFGLWTAGLLARMVGDRALYFAAAPTLMLYAFLNWDLVPVALTTAGLYAFLRGRDGRGGAWLGFGAAAKAYPGLLVIPLALDRVRAGGSRRAAALVAGAGAAWLTLNLPVALAGFERWSEFFRFSSTREPTSGTLWYTACRPLTGSAACGAAGLVNAASAAAFLLLVVLVGWLRWRRQPAFPRWLLAFPVLVAFLLTAKVYSPQYSLWLLPWFALVLPDLRVFLAFEAVDVGVFLTEFTYLGAGRGSGAPAVALGIAVLARAGVLAWLLSAFARGRVRAPELSFATQFRTNTSPSASS